MLIQHMCFMDYEFGGERVIYNKHFCMECGEILSEGGLSIDEAKKITTHDCQTQPHFIISEE